MWTGEDIRALRTTIKWNQDRLARYLGVDRSSVAHMENGRPARGPVLRLLDRLKAAADSGDVEMLCPEAAE